MTDDDDTPSVLRSGRRLSRPHDNVSNEPPPAQHATTNVRDTNPPPPDKSEFSLTEVDDSQVDDSQLSPSLLSVDESEFTTIGRAHVGRGTTTPRDAHSASISSPNQFDALAQDDDSSDEPSHHTDDAPTDAIDNIFREADATLAAATH